MKLEGSNEEKLATCYGFGLYDAIVAEQDELVALAYIRGGARLDLASDGDGMTALMCAALHGMKDAVQAMVTSGRKVLLNAQDHRGWTALHAAAHRGHPEIVQLLISAGADLGIPDKENRTPLDHAQDKGHRQAAAIITFALNGHSMTQSVTITDAPVIVARPLQFRNREELTPSSDIR